MIRAYVIPNALLCAECGRILMNTSRLTTTKKGAASYTCVNSDCTQLDKKAWYHYKEVILDDEVK